MAQNNNFCANFSIAIDLIFFCESTPFRKAIKVIILALFQALRKSIQLSKVRFRINPSLLCAKYLKAKGKTTKGATLGLDDIDIDRTLFISNFYKSVTHLEDSAWVAVAPAGVSSSSSPKFICQILFYEDVDEEKNAVGAGSSCECRFTAILTSIAEYNLRKSCELPFIQRRYPEEFQLISILSAPDARIDAKSLRHFYPIKAGLLELTPLKSTYTINDIGADAALNQHFHLPKYISRNQVVSVTLPNSVSQKPGQVVSDYVVTNLQFQKGSADGIRYGRNQLFIVSSDYTTLYVRPNNAINGYHIRDCPQSFIHPTLLQYSEKIVKALTLGIRATNFPPHILLSGAIGNRLSSVGQGAARLFGVNLHVVNAINLIGDTGAYTEAKLKTLVQQIKLNLPCLAMMTNIHLLGKDKEGREDKRVILAFQDFLTECQNACMNAGVDKLNSFFVGVTHAPEKVSQALAHSFHHHIRVSLLLNECPTNFDSDMETGKTATTSQLEGIMNWMTNACGVEFDESASKWLINGLKRRPSLKEFDDVFALLAAAVRSAFVGCGLNSSPFSFLHNDEEIVQRKLFRRLVLNENHLSGALDELESGFGFGGTGLNIGKVPHVNWEDIGGLNEIKSELINSIQLPLRFPHFFQSGLMRSGILLYGPPGTGKTLVAKAVATEFKLGFISVKGPELLNMYVGQSEQNVREVFEKARSCAPCIVFFDELDALAPNRGKSGDSGGVMDRVVSQILAEMDGTQNKSFVFILGATNRPDLIDSALLRPGRFDKLLYIGPSTDGDTFKKILQAQTRKFNMSSDVDLDAISGRLPSGMTGADLSALCSNAYMIAIERRITLLEADGSADTDSTILVTQADFERALRQVTVSLSPKDILNYEKLKHMTR